jgi:molybdopterin/thiamine biosynthesis adenylyltransferase
MSIKPQTPLDESDLTTMLIAGVGNIGSSLAPLVARMGVRRILLIDPDVYEAKNLACQDILASDVGKSKAVVQARRLRRINPAIDAKAYCCRVENLPVGVLSVNAIMSCLDSRISRLYLSEAAWRLGVPMIDAAVDASSLLARANVYIPGPDSVCWQCTLDAEDYDIAALEQPYPCEQGGNGAVSTNAPASLGLIAAGLMAIEGQKLLAGDRQHLLAGRQVMLDLRDHTHHVTSFQRKHCRFDHETWQVEQIEDSPARMTLGEAAQLAANGSNHSNGCALRIEGQHFATMQCCPGCGHHEAIALCLAGRIPRARRRCAACGQSMTVRGFDMREWLNCESLGGQDLARPLSTLGVEPCDVLSIRGATGQRHFVLGGNATAHSAGNRANGRRPPPSNGTRR